MSDDQGKKPADDKPKERPKLPPDWTGTKGETPKKVTR